MNSSSSANTPFIECHGLGKKYGSKVALSNVNFTLQAGEIVGLIGPNGAGKSTLLKAIMGLVKHSGSLQVFGQSPYKSRSKLLKKMSYIADVASLPSWMKVADLLQFVASTHPAFDIHRARQLIEASPVQLTDGIGSLSKGMKTRLHLAIILSINTDLLILDEPTLGLDVMVRREFQDQLVQEYYNQNRSILVTTHQVDEIESILTRVMFIREGNIAMDVQLSELKTRYRKLVVDNDSPAPPANLSPMYQRKLPNKTEYVFSNDSSRDDSFRGMEDSTLAQYGELTTPSLEDLFVASNAGDSPLGSMGKGV